MGSSRFPGKPMAKILDKPMIGHVYESVSKCDLLRLIAEVYGRKIKLINNKKFKINRSLNDERFQAETGYISPDWPELIKLMYKYK